MAEHPVIVPHSGVVEEVIVVEWLRRDGDEVVEGEPVVVIESEKAETELTAPSSGRLSVLVGADPDVEIPVGTTLGAVLT